MTRPATIPAILGILVGGMAAGLAGCGSNKVAIGLQDVDAAAGRDVPSATNGGSAAGAATGGATGVGGVVSTAGSVGAGGNTGAGGTLGTGGASSTGNVCGGFVGRLCAAGEMCEIPAGHCCCDYSGTCVAKPQVCSMMYQPVCGCDGKTYPSDCDRQVAGVSKDFDGACPTTDAGTGGSTGTGGITGAGGSNATGGATGGGGTTGGATGSGGSKATGGTTGGGGSKATGGILGSGGSKATGGASGTGGTGGSTGKQCGGLAGLLCATGEICDMDPGTCNFGDPGGTCVVKPQGCTTDWNPVCGCDGKTYSNNCSRLAVGASKNYDGECATADAGQDVGPSGDAASPAALCTATGGAVSSSLCCSATSDFPNSCLVGACGCAPANSHTVSTCTCGAGCFLPGYGCAGPAGTCTVGADQTCNDNLAFSSIRGRCVADGRCVCAPGALLASGKCQ